MNLLIHECEEQARKIVQSYRSECPEGYDPQNYVATAIALIGAVVAAAGTAVSALGMQQQAHAQKQMAEYNAKVSLNAAIAAKQQAQFDADRIRERGKMILGTQTANALKSGVTISGTVQDVMNDSATNNELDALSAIYKGQIGADSNVASSNLSKYQGDVAQSTAAYNTGGTILSGAGQSASGFGSAYAIQQRYNTRNQPDFR